MAPKSPTSDATQLRVVVDTNVLISGLLSNRGATKEVIDRWLAGEFTLIASEQMISECERILEHPTLKERLGLSDVPRGDLITMLRDEVQKVETPVPALNKAVRNPFEAIVLMSAVTGEARYLVTGEEELLTLGEYEGIKIITPERFAQTISGQVGLPGL